MTAKVVGTKIDMYFHQNRLYILSFLKVNKKNACVYSLHIQIFVMNMSFNSSSEVKCIFNDKARLVMPIGDPRD